MNHRFSHVSRGWAAGLLACSLGLFALGAQASDDPPGRVGRLADMKGQVWLLEGGQGEWQTATRNRPVTTGDRLATDRDSRVEVQIGSTTVRLGESADLEVARLDDDRIELMLHDGAASMSLREPEVARELQLTTPEGRYQPRTPGLFRVDRGQRGSFAASITGEIDFESRDSQLTVRTGQRAEFWIDPADQRTHYSWASMPNDEFEQWVRKDEQRDQRYAARRPVSPEMTGAEDLEGHGRGSQHPEYGSVWYPTAVAVGWAPYRFGRWAWVRPWGWTWVDDAPWGFAPFHYGRWVHWGGRWAWAPGTYVRRPVYAPAMVGWIGGGGLSLSLQIGGGRGGPPVGWVPLAPREVYYPQYRHSNVYIQQVNVTHIHVKQKIVEAPGRPVMYTNRGVPGGVTVVSSDVLTQRQSVGNAARPSDDVVMRAVRSDRGLTHEAPPVPANASQAPRVPQSAGALAAPARPSIDRPRVSTLNGDEGRGPRPGPERRTEIGGGLGAAAGAGDEGRGAAARPTPERRADSPAVAPAPGRPAVPRPPVSQAVPREERVPHEGRPQREERIQREERSAREPAAVPMQRREPAESHSQAAPRAVPAPQPAQQAVPREERQERKQREREAKREGHRESRRDGASGMN